MLKQRRFFTRFEFLLGETHIQVTERRITSSRSYNVPFENVTADPMEVMVSSRGRFWATLVFAALTLLVAILQIVGGDVDQGAWIVWGSFTIVTGAAYWMSRRTYLVFNAGQPALVVLKGRPSEEVLSAFLEEMQKRKRAYLAQRYLASTSEGAPADTIHKLAWLREMGVVSPDEFDVLKSDVVRRAEEALPPPSDTEMN